MVMTCRRRMDTLSGQEVEVETLNQGLKCLCLSQHVQLLAQVHLLCRHLDALNHEASVTKHYLVSKQSVNSQ